MKIGLPNRKNIDIQDNAVEYQKPGAFTELANLKELSLKEMCTVKAGYMTSVGYLPSTAFSGIVIKHGRQI